MWKIISLFSLLIVAQAANIDDIYGEWWEVAFYPVYTYVPLCIHFRFAKATEPINCTYADGSNASVLRVTMMNESGDIRHRSFVPVTVVNTAAEVMPALNNSATCDDKNLRDYGVIRVVNEDYFILYSTISPGKQYTRTEVEQNHAILFGKKLIPSERLSAVMLSIEELKNRQGAQMCGTENYGKLEHVW